MYIDVVPNRNSPPAVLLRESTRVGAKTQKRTLANLSALPAEAIAALRVILKGGQVVEAGGQFVIEQSLPCGHVQAIRLAMQRLGMEQLISSKACPERDAVLAMIAQRLIRPGSKLESAALFADTTLADDFGLSGIDENALYAAMDWLLERQPHIERKLAQRHLRADAMVFYDVSSSSYYGTHCPLAVRGYNRDGLKLPSIVYGLLTDQEGRPIAVRVYPGNTADPATIPDQIDALRKAFNVERFVIVGDRGMLTKAQIDKLRLIDGCGWISCLRTGDIRKLIEARDPSDAPLFTHTDLAELQHPDFPGERLIACFNPILALDRAQTREELLVCTEKLLTKLAEQVANRKETPLLAAEIGVKVGRVVNKYKVAKHFALTITDGCLTWSRKQANIDREKALDGIYIVRTSEPNETLSKADAVRAYKRLGNVEKAFRTFKGVDLRIRPINHFLENRVRAHILLCMLTYYVEWHMRQALASLLYADEDLEANRNTREPVAKAVVPPAVQRKRTTKEATNGQPLRRWDGLIHFLSTIVRNTCRIGEGTNAVRFTRITEISERQAQVFELLKKDSPVWAKMCPVEGTTSTPSK